MNSSAGLDRVLEEYREACPEPEPSLGFVPALWKRIESQKLFLRRAKGWTSAYVTVAAAICLILAILISLQAGPVGQAYVDILDNTNESAAAAVEASSHAAANATPAPPEKSQEKR